LVSNLIFAIFHYSLSLPGHAPGWSWSINISLQELFFILCYFSLFALNSYKGSILILILFAVLVAFRGSGKTTLFVLFSIGPVYYSALRFKFIEKFLDWFIFVYFFGFFVVVSYFVFGLKSEVEVLYLGLSSLWDQGVPFLKRFTLIVEAIYFLGVDHRNYFLGAGFGVANYVNVMDLRLNNTPQVFALTLMVYGGIFLLFVWALLFYLLRREFLHLCVENSDRLFVKSSMVLLLVFLTTHEYFNNPFLFLGLFVLSMSLNISFQRKSKNG
jgi:hypothetical protein